MRCLFLMPFIAITALLLLLVPTTHTNGILMCRPCRGSLHELRMKLRAPLTGRLCRGIVRAPWTRRR